MSYGIGLVIIKDDLDKSEIRYDYCDWTLPITVTIHPEDCKKNFKDKWYPSFKNETKTTTMDTLLKAPCDCVCIIDKEGDFETLQNRTPISGEILSLHDFLTLKFK